MRRSFENGFKTVLAIIVLAGIIMVLQQVSVYAAFNDRSPEGAKVMPSNRTLTVPVGKAFKINFGTEYDYEKFYYFKIKPTKTGYITFTSDYVHGYSVVLLNGSKKLVSRGEKSYDDFYSAGSSYKYQTFINYGVKKGRTYYIRVKGASTERESYDQPYVGSVKWTNTKISRSKYGTKKAKAKAIKRKKTVKGLILAGSGKAQWYKITSKKKNVNLTFKAPKTNGTIKVTTYIRQYGHKGKWISSTHSASRGGSYVKGPLTNYNGTKWTIYLKVQRSVKSSGYYTVRWS